MRITIEIAGGFKVILGRVGFGWRRGGVRAFSPDPLWRTWWELRAGVVELGRDHLVPIVYLLQPTTAGDVPANGGSMKHRTRLAALVVALFLLAGCTSDIASITVPDVPEAGNIAGAWAGNARWDAVQGGAAGAVTSGAATSIMFQNGATILGSTWEVPGVFAGTLTGSVDPAGNATGTAPVTPFGAGCTASAPWGGKLDGDQLAVTMSYADPGTVPCAAAPVGLTLNLAR